MSFHKTEQRPATLPATVGPWLWGTLVLAVVAVGSWMIGTEPEGSAPSRRRADRDSISGAAKPAPARVASTTPADWPLVRGDATGTGVVTGTLPARLAVAWTFRTPTEKAGFVATPVVASGRVFLGDTAGNFFAIDLATGEQRWKHFVDTAYLAGAAVRDGRVFLGDGNGVIRCLDAATGDERWKFDTESGAEISGSPNFYQGNVLVGSQDGTLYALAAATGKLAWKVQLEDQIRCTPSVVGARTFVAGCDSKLHIIDLDAGQEAAAVEVRDQTASSPAALGDRIYFRSQGGKVFCVDWKTAQIIWKADDDEYAGSQQNRASVAVTDKILLCAGVDKKVHGLDPATGAPRWPWFRAKGRIESSPVIAGNYGYLADADGRVQVLDLTTGKPVSHYDAGGSFLGGPAVADGRLLLPNEDGGLYCFVAE